MKKNHKSTTSYIHIYIRMKIQHVRVLVVLNTTVETMNDKFLKNIHYIEYTYLLALLYTCSIWLIVVEVKLCGKQVDRLSTNIIWQSHCKGSVTLDKREQNVFFDSFLNKSPVHERHVFSHARNVVIKLHVLSSIECYTLTRPLHVHLKKII